MLLAEVDVVDVSARAVGEQRDERRVEPVGAQQLLDAVGEGAVIVSRNVVVLAGADIVQGVVGQQGDGAPVGGLHGNQRDLRVGGPGGLDEVRAGDRRVHSHEVIGAAERIGRNGAGLHYPAAVEHLIRLPADAPGDLRRRKVVNCPATPSAMRPARNSKYWLSGSLWKTAAQVGAVWVWVAEISTWPGSSPYFSSIRRLAASMTSRGIMQLSHTTMASRVWPSSSTRQRACSSS